MLWKITDRKNALRIGTIAIVVIAIISLSQNLLQSANPIEKMEHRRVLVRSVDCTAFDHLSKLFREKGYVVYRPVNLSEEILNGAEAFTAKIKGKRIQDAWTTDEHVKNLAMHPEILNLLECLHGKAVFPFQTLNFPEGTEQPIHSDIVHFDTLPTRGLMTAAWVALEDIYPDSGPLIYYTGSHLQGLWDYDQLGMRTDFAHRYKLEDYGPYETLLSKAIDASGLKPHHAKLRRGEIFVWAASLLHGGGPITNRTRTRRSQVTHYYLEGAQFYTVPRLSNFNKYDQIQFKSELPRCLETNCVRQYLKMFKNNGFKSNFSY